MTIADEEQWIGEEMHLVPSLYPDDDCNGKKKMKEGGEVVRNEDNHVIFGGYCNNKAGFKTDHVGEGRCKYHAGQAGAPAHNQNAQKHALDADPHHYHENLPIDEQEWIEQVTDDILRRIRRRHGRDPDFIDQTLSRLVAIELHIVFQATDYTKDELVQVIVHDGSSHEEKGALVEEVRRYANDIISNLDKLGLMDSPESQKADEMGQWRQFLESGGSGGQDDTIKVENEAEGSD